MTAVVKRSNQLDVLGDLFEIFDDFDKAIVAGDLWTPDTSDSSSAATLFLTLATTGNCNGILSMTQDATDNDELYLGMTCLPFLIRNNKPLVFETRIQYAEGATDDNNVMVGFISTKADDTLIDNGGGPVASATMAVIYKVDGGTVWRTRSQVGAAVGQTDSISDTTAGGSAYQTLRVEINPVSSTVAEVIYSVDGVQLKTAAGVPIKDRLVYTNAVVMGAFVGIKNGSNTAEVLLCDYVYAAQKR
jgi:hypothetical protein